LTAPQKSAQLSTHFADRDPWQRFFHLAKRLSSLAVRQNPGDSIAGD
jgi:hypothetical protein